MAALGQMNAALQASQEQMHAIAYQVSDLHTSVSRLVTDVADNAAQLRDLRSTELRQLADIRGAQEQLALSQDRQGQRSQGLARQLSAIRTVTSSHSQELQSHGHQLEASALQLADIRACLDSVSQHSDESMRQLADIRDRQWQYGRGQTPALSHEDSIGQPLHCPS